MSSFSQTYLSTTRAIIDGDRRVCPRAHGRSSRRCAPGDGRVVVPPLNEERVTPYTEGPCAVLWQLFVSHP